MYSLPCFCFIRPAFFFLHYMFYRDGGIGIDGWLIGLSHGCLTSLRRVLQDGEVSLSATEGGSAERRAF